MNLPINIEKLIKGELVETDRIEYKSGWNPESVIHTMCAFANDINNLGGGYIVMGVDEKNGVPQLPPKGLQKNQIDAIQKKLVELSNLIQPTYFGISDLADIEGSPVLVLHCPGGDNRPYTAPVSLSKKNKEHAHWVRRYNSTVRANPQEEQMLHEMAAKIPFDDRINHQASVQDLSISLIKEFLQKQIARFLNRQTQFPLKSYANRCRLLKGRKSISNRLMRGCCSLLNNPSNSFRLLKLM